MTFTILINELEFHLIYLMAKVIMHKSFPYAPCINTSQPSDLFYTCNNLRSLSSHSHNLITTIRFISLS